MHRSLLLTLLVAFAQATGAWAQSPQEAQFDSTIHRIAVLEKALEGKEKPAKKVEAQREIIRLYGEALRWSDGRVNMLMRGLTINAYGRLSWFLLLDKKPAEAQAMAELTLRAGNDYNMDWVYVNLALAYLYQGKWDEAKGIILSWKGKPIDKERSFEAVFLEDLDKLKKAGVWHRDVKRARALLQ
jgi:hypothetical protein